MLNPFVRSENQPKVPDGKLPTSIGTQNRAAYDYLVTDNDKSGEYVTTYIVMLPHITQPVLFYKVKSTNVNEPNSADTVVSAIFHDRIRDAVGQVQYELDNVYLKLASQLNVWRQVSQGLRILPTSSLNNMSGYFESVSISMPQDPDHWTVQPDGGTILTGQYIANIEKTVNSWRDSDSYTVGDLHELPKLQFNQVVNDSAHTPIYLRNRYHVGIQPVVADQPAVDADLNLRGSHTILGKKDLITDVMDYSYQMRVFRLRTNLETSLFVVSQVNNEQQFKFGSLFRGYQTRNPDEPHPDLSQTPQGQQGQPPGVSRNMPQVSPPFNARRILRT